MTLRRHLTFFSVFANMYMCNFGAKFKPVIFTSLFVSDDTEEDDEDDLAPPLPPRRSESLLKSPLYNNGTQEQEIPTVLTANLIEDLALQGM